MLLTLVIGFLITVVLSPFFIPFLRKLKFGQSIRDEGPQWHQKKTGTPTMGGIMIVISVFVTCLLVMFRLDSFEQAQTIVALLLVTLGYGLIGFIDDYIKVVKKRNLGLTSKQKLIGQILIAILFFAYLLSIDHSTVISIPGTTFSIDLGIFYFLFILFWMVGFSNALNLTDGLDGLLSGTSAIAFGAFALIAWNVSQIEISLFSLAVVGALLGFLVFNANPAKIFMGDTGSLALGGGIAAVSILLKMELLLVIIGIVFVCETLSVILQVASFKLTGKRIFKMSPLHHHYELCGWSEWRVVITFWLTGFIFAILGMYIEVWM